MVETMSEKRSGRHLMPFLMRMALVIISVSLNGVIFNGVASSLQPNVVLVMADDQGWGDVGFNGHPHIHTPEMDRMAKEGLVFERFYAGASVCSPTRGSVMTGRNPNRFGCFSWGHSLRPQEQTVGELFRAAGYRTGHFGKWHIGSVQAGSSVNPGASGFDEWVSAPNFYETGAILSKNGRAVQTSGESSVMTMDYAIDFMDRSIEDDSPYLSVVWFGSPHGPHIATEEDRNHYGELPKPNQHFLGEITGMDRALVRLREFLEEKGVRDNTLVWYCSDNGSLPRVGSSGPFRGRKGQVYEGGLLVPSMVEWPAVIKEPRVVSGRAVTSDLLPTLAAIVGVADKILHPLDGINLFNVIQGDSFNKRPSSMGFWNFPERGIRTPSAEWMKHLMESQKNGIEPNDPLKLRPNAGTISKTFPPTFNAGHATMIDGAWKIHRIHKPDAPADSTRWELYNLNSDPYESTNLINDDSVHGHIKQLMKSNLEKWQRSVIHSLNGGDYQH